MKRLALSLFALALTVASIAQNNNKQVPGADKQKHERHEGHAGKRDGFKGHDLQEKLNLTDQQQQQAKALREDFKKQMSTLKEDKSLTDEQRKEKMKEMAKQQHEKMQSILTPEQKEQAEKMRSEMKQKHQEGDKDGAKEKFRDGAKKDKKLKEELNLTDAQSAQLKTINESFKNDMKAIHQNSSLTQEQKKEQAKALQQKHRDQVQSLLTTEQKAKMKGNMKNHKDRRAVK
jgi:Spy/CpxP family protein refolding chaperone